MPGNIEHKRKTGWLIPLLLFGFVFLAWGVSWYLLSDDPNRGTFGDMFGSVNALFSGLAFSALIYTIFLQRVELKLHKHELELTREEIKAQKEQMQAQNQTLKKQNFEDTFFQLLRMHNDITNSIDLVISGSVLKTAGVVKGKDCFEYLHKEFSRTWHVQESKFQAMNELGKINSIYQDFYKIFEPEIGHYFRNLYNVIKFVDSANVRDKKFYTNLVRAQLSSMELVMIFYSALSDLGREKFKPLIEEYALLKNLPERELLNPEHPKLYDGGAYSFARSHI